MTATLSPSLSALDSPDYDPLTHLDAIFSHPSTLTRVTPTLSLLHTHESHLTTQITSLSTDQAQSHATCLSNLQTSRRELADLLFRVDDLRNKALTTQQTITAMTAEIKSLDTTKKNLAHSMTTLKRLQMLSTAFSQLRGVVVRGRQYGEAARLLGAVVQLEEHFRAFRSVDQIALLSKEVGILRGEVEEQVREDFELAWSREEVVAKQGVLREGCEVVEVLGVEARMRLVNWYVNAELRGYRGIFRGEGEAGGLDNVDRRYAWWRKMVKGWEEVWVNIFPVGWRVGEKLAESFAEGTREDYRGVLARMTRAGQGVDVGLLLSALQQTLEFEQGLERRFAGSDSRTSLDTTVSSDGQGVLGGQLISSVFEPYLGLWVDAQERELGSLLPQYKARPIKPPEEDFSSQMVVTSASELFNFYRLSLQQCAKLSTGQSLLDLSKVFAHFLDVYAQQVLLFYLSEKPTGGTPSRVPGIEDIICVLNTADYCYNTTQSLSDKIQSRIDEPLKESVDLSSQADAFMGIASASVRALVRVVEIALEPSWREMRNIGWSRIETAADKSSFMAPLQQAIRSKTASILDLIHKPQYSRSFADNLVELLASTYLSQIVLCRPISEGGAEQMLLDLHEMKSTLSSILPGDAPALYLKRLNTTFGRIEPLLKTLQVRPQPPEALVQAYLVHIADLSDANFRKILDLKGLTRRQETNQLIELYQMHKFSPRYKDSLTERSLLLTPLLLSNPTAVTATTAGAGVALQNLSALGNSAAQSLSTANLPANMKFDASGLGNAIMDRFSTPTIGTPQQTQSPPVNSAGMGNPMEGGDALSQQGGLNENLKNIGKFFRRDLGGLGLGGRFGQSSSTSPAPPEDRR